MKTIKGSELVDKEFEVLDDGTLRLIENNQTRYIPMTGEDYYYIDNFGHVNNTENNGTVYDKWLINHHLVFKTKEECEEYKKFLELLDKYKCDFNWNDCDINKYRLDYDWERYEIIVDFNNNYQLQGSFYFKSEKLAQEFIEEAGVEHIKRFMFDMWE